MVTVGCTPHQVPLWSMFWNMDFHSPLGKRVTCGQAFPSNTYKHKNLTSFLSSPRTHRHSKDPIHHILSQALTSYEVISYHVRRLEDARIHSVIHS